MKTLQQARPGLEQRYARLKRSPRAAPFIAIAERFAEIDGSTQGGLLSIQFFTVVIPLMIIGFAHSSGFAANISVGELFIRGLGLQHPFDDRVREAFGGSSGIQSIWTFFGLAAFLVWGIPMAIGVAAMFGQAWRRQPFGAFEKFARGAVWFTLYLGTMAAHERIAFAGQHGGGVRAVLFVVALVPVWILWSLTPALLVRDGWLGWRTLLLAGLVGVLIDGIVLATVVRVGFPILLKGWMGFGPIGVAMTLMSWCGALAVGWVVIACTGAILRERTAPGSAVVAPQAAGHRLTEP